MKIKIALTVCFAFVFFMTSCNRNKDKIFEIGGDVQGTYYHVVYFTQDDRDYTPEVDSILRVVDENFSLWNNQSLIVRINNSDTALNITPLFKELFGRSMLVSEATGGAFDITLGSLTGAWGFGANEDSLTQDINVLKDSTGYREVWIENGKLYKKHKNIKLDMNAIAQGFSVDLISRFFDSVGVKSYLVDIGGEIFGRGIKPDGKKWKIGIEKPADDKDAVQHIEKFMNLEDMAVVTSGNYRKYFEKDGVRFSHTIDPNTGYPIKNKMLSATVYTDNATDADAYATAFMVMGADKAMDFLNKNKSMEGFFIFSDENGQPILKYTEGFDKLLVGKE